MGSLLPEKLLVGFYGQNKYVFARAVQAVNLYFAELRSLFPEFLYLNVLHIAYCITKKN